MATILTPFSRRIERQHYKFLGEFINPGKNTSDLLRASFPELVSHLLIGKLPRKQRRPGSKSPIL